jgi:hypothetical protein
MRLSQGLISKNRVESLSHDKLESQFSFLRLRDFGDRIDTRREVFIPIVFRTPSLHITQYSLAKVVSEESSKGLISLRTVWKDHLSTIITKNVFSETGDFIVILLNIRIILYTDVNIPTSGLIAIMYLPKQAWTVCNRSRPFWIE